jgi:hypothetical protein
MSSDGSRSAEETTVDWDRGVSEKDLPHLQRIVEELVAKH